MENETNELAELIKNEGLTMDVENVKSRPDGKDLGWDVLSRHWKCIIRRRRGNRGGDLLIYFSQGSAHTKAPTLEDVLQCLHSDFNWVTYGDYPTGLVHGGGFEEWAGNMGWDKDSRKAERIYKSIVDQVERFHCEFGQDTLDRFLAIDPNW